MTVVGGYLGAGKTTLINRLLGGRHGRRLAVLVNDFGSINIDADLIESEDGDTISLANGCICCSLVDGFAAALATVREIEPTPERLVIEASGVADPAAIAAYGHGPGLSLDAVVVVADAETVQNRSRDKYVGDTVLTQLRSADILVLNKIDLVDSDTADAIRTWLREIVPTAVVAESIQSQVPPSLLFGFVRPDGSAPAPESDGAGHKHGSVDEPDHQHGEELFESWSWTGTEPLERAAIERLMDALPDQIVRAKGRLALLDEPDRAMVLQRVGGRWSLRPQGPWGDTVESQLVFIGIKGAIDDHWLAELLNG